MYKFCLVLVLMITACNPPNIPSAAERNENDNNSYYIVMCKHPLGHVMRHVVSSKAWRDTYGSRNGVFRFRDVEGVYHENSMGCYTNDKIRVDKQGEAKQ